MEGISIVIVCYKSELDLEGLVDSVFVHTDVSQQCLQIVVVDNYGDGDEQGITDRLSQKYDAEFVYRKSDFNGGYGSGNNIGFNLAKYDIVCVINPDVRLIKPLFRKVISEFNNDSNLLALSGEQISSAKISFFLRPEFQFPIGKAVITRAIKYIGKFSPRFMALSGAMTFYKKQLFREIGLFDENIFLYCEEADVAVRADRAGLRVSYLKEIKYIHLDWDRMPASASTVENLISSVSYYADKHKFSCKGYFLAGLTHSYISYAWLRLHKRSGEADRAMELVSLFWSKIKGV